MLRQARSVCTFSVVSRQLSSSHLHTAARMVLLVTHDMCPCLCTIIHTLNARRRAKLKDLDAIPEKMQQLNALLQSGDWHVGKVGYTHLVGIMAHHRMFLCTFTTGC